MSSSAALSSSKTSANAMRLGSAITGATTLLLSPLILSPVLASTTPVSSVSPVSATIPSLSVSSDSQAPTVPILARPLDETITSDSRPELVWKRSVDLGSNTVFYTVYLDNVATYLGVSDLGNSSGAGYTARLDGDEVKLLPTNALSEGQHSWYVVAEDLSGNRRSSTTWSLTIDLTLPSLSLENLENQDPGDLSASPTFDFTGPRTVHLTVSTEPYALVSVTIINSQGQTLTTLTGDADARGSFVVYYHLEEGLFSFLITALDRANLTSSLPEFFVRITEPSLPLPTLPGGLSSGLNLPPQLPLPNLPSLSSLPASISQVSSRGYLAIILSILIAMGLGILIVIAWKRRYNLVLLDSTGQPLPSIEIHHSMPSSHHTAVYTTNRYGRIYIPSLSRFSELTLCSSSVKLLLSITSPILPLKLHLDF